MESRKGVKLRDTVEREKLYEQVLTLRTQGLSYNQIIKRVESDHGTKLRKSHISGWVNGKHRPFGYVTEANLSPSIELAYVIGVKMGDASVNSNRNHNHMIKLRVIDKDFAEEFARCLSVILKRNPPRVRWSGKTRSWHAELSSLLLQRVLRLDVEQLLPTISHCDSCKAAFLRGFFDSEGSISKRSLTASNENLHLLKLVCELLASLGIGTTGPHLSTKGGRLVMIKGRFFRQNEDLHYVRVRSKCLETFRRIVGFSIRRKSDALSAATMKSTDSERASVEKTDFSD